MAKVKTRDLIRAEVARLLRQERIKREFSLNFVAGEAGLSRQMVSYVEQEERNPSLDTLLRITEVLNVDLNVIIKQARISAS